MADPYEFAEQVRQTAAMRSQAESMASLAKTLQFQAESARRSEHVAWWVSGGSLLVAIGSLVVATISLIERLG